MKKFLVAAACTLGVTGVGVGLAMGARAASQATPPAHRSLSPPLPRVPALILARAARSVFGTATPTSVSSVVRSEDLGGNVVTVDTPAGELQLLEDDQQIIFASFRNSKPSTKTPTVSADVASSHAEQLVDRIYPWAKALQVTCELHDHGTYVSYAIKWRQITNGVMMPSWVNATVTSGGDVENVAANHFPDAAAPATHIGEDAAIAAAVRALGPPATPANASLQMGMIHGQMRTFWVVNLLKNVAPDSTGIAPLPGHQILIDAITGDLLLLA